MNDALYNRLQAVTDNIIEKVGSYTEAQQKHKPSPEAWCMLEVLEHLLIAERGIILFFEKYPPANSRFKPTFGQRIRGNLVIAGLGLPIRSKAPAFVSNLKGTYTFEELKTSWQETRRSILQYARDLPKDKYQHSVIKHAAAGPLTMKQILRFMHKHVLHHTAQINRIARSLPSS